MIRYSLRLPDDLHAALEALAHDNRRSLNAEMLDRLWASVNDAVLAGFIWNPGGEVQTMAGGSGLRPDPKTRLAEWEPRGAEGSLSSSDVSGAPLPPKSGASSRFANTSTFRPDPK